MGEMLVPRRFGIEDHPISWLDGWDLLEVFRSLHDSFFIIVWLRFKLGSILYDREPTPDCGVLSTT
jgi:hypothetical protein